LGRPGPSRTHRQHRRHHHHHSQHHHHHHHHHIISIIVIIVIIINVFGACCEGSWPMLPASGAIHWWWPVLLAMLVSGVGEYLHMLCPNYVFKSEFEGPKLAFAKYSSF
jgi:uncharacterized ion transporter superfamily protein YfcC